MSEAPKDSFNSLSSLSRADQGRTLKDYRPQHDEDCSKNCDYCALGVCDFDEHESHQECSCGLDALLALTDGETAQAASVEHPMVGDWIRLDNWNGGPRIEIVSGEPFDGYQGRRVQIENRGSVPISEITEIRRKQSPTRSEAFMALKDAAPSKEHPRG